MSTISECLSRKQLLVGKLRDLNAMRHTGEISEDELATIRERFRGYLARNRDLLEQARGEAQAQLPVLEQRLAAEQGAVRDVELRIRLAEIPVAQADEAQRQALAALSRAQEDLDRIRRELSAKSSSDLGGPVEVPVNPDEQLALVVAKSAPAPPAGHATQGLLEGGGLGTLPWSQTLIARLAPQVAWVPLQAAAAATAAGVLGAAAALISLTLPAASISVLGIATERATMAGMGSFGVGGLMLSIAMPAALALQDRSHRAVGQLLAGLAGLACGLLLLLQITSHALTGVGGGLLLWLLVMSAAALCAAKAASEA